MDPHTMMNGANARPYSLAEIFHFPMTDGGGGGQGVGQFVNAAAVNHGGECDDPMSLSGDGGGDSGCKKRREEETATATATSNGNGSNNGDGKRLKTSEGRGEKNDSKAESEPSSGKPVEQKAQPPEPVKDYIHVRARRGQATDSHSLAERARREKISERMKILQDLVPGCNKVIGKALVLDEIINYIQSLQRQVEFLSMKLETVNSRMNPGFEVFQSKDFGQQAFDANAMAFSSQAAREFSRGSSPEWLHMQENGATAMLSNPMHVEIIGRRKHARRQELEINFTSKRRVPNGPDPIHNRRAGNTRRPPGRS